VGTVPTGGLALAAMDAGPKWYVIGTLAVLMLPWAALIYVAIAMFQLRAADNRYPGVRKARVALTVFAVIAGGMLLAQATAR
jgi:hypothetical protein